MNFKFELLKPGPCPFCGKPVYVLNKQGRSVKKNRAHCYLWVLFNDESKGNFSCCKACILIVTRDKVDALMSRQIYTWGMEAVTNPLGLFNLVAELKWYIGHAVHLKIVKWSNTEDGLAS